MGIWIVKPGTTVYLYDEESDKVSSYLCEKEVSYDFSSPDDQKTWFTDVELCLRIVRRVAQVYNHLKQWDLMVVDLPKNKRQWTHLVFISEDGEKIK